MFLKEYEQLITEKNNEIKTLNEQLSKTVYDQKEAKLDVKGKFEMFWAFMRVILLIELNFQIKTLKDEIREKDKKIKGR